VLDERITRVKELIAQREEIDTELSALLGVEPRPVKQRTCKKCGQPGHRADTCPTQQPAQ
jgi:hypothetical protein